MRSRGTARPEAQSHNITNESGDTTMKIIAIIAGLVFLSLGAAALAGMLAIAKMYAIVLAIAGLVFLGYGLAHRRELTPLRNPNGPDMRDLV